MTYRFRNPDLHQEDDTIPWKKVVLTVAVALGISAALVVWAVAANAGHEAELRPSGVFPEQWVGPRHAVARVRQDVFGEQRGRSFEARQREALGSYGWIDEGRGLVRIPIERAMDLVLAGSKP